jgi:hypothetical protein
MDARVRIPPRRGIRFATAALLAFFAMHTVVALAADGGAKANPAFTFNSVAYFARWSQGSQHEFTPAGQEDLDKWSDMLTANVYKGAHDGESLAKMANAVLGNYKDHQAVIVKTDSVPRTTSRPTEHLVVAVFGQPAYLEIAFNRLVIVDGTGCSFTYSHRIYGAKAGNSASAWLSANGPNIEKVLMSWQPPSPKTLAN